MFQLSFLCWLQQHIYCNKIPSWQTSFQSNVKSVCRSCILSCTKLSVNETRVISFSRETKFPGFEYQLYESSVTRNHSNKYLRVPIYSKLDFHHYVDHVLSQAIRLFDFIWPFSFSCLQNLLLLCYTSVVPTLEHVPFARNWIASVDASQLQHNRRMFLILLSSSLFQSQCNYANILNYITFYTLIV